MAYSHEEIWGALKACRGRILLTADRLGCAPNTIRNHIAKDPEMGQYVIDQRMSMVDKAELKFEQAILAGEPWAVAMALKTLGKDRGYVEKTQIEQSGELKMYAHDAPTEAV